MASTPTISATRPGYTVAPQLAHLPATASAIKEAYPQVTRAMASAVIILPYRPSLSHSPHLSLPPPLASAADIPHTLLVQRSLKDSFPGLWEYAGGSFDPEEPTIYDTVAREVKEETGLTVRAITGFLGVEEWGEGEKNRWGKFSYIVEVEEGADAEVKIAEGEHDAFVWASLEGVQFMVGTSESNPRANVDWTVGAPRGPWEFVVRDVGDRVLEAFEMWKAVKTKAEESGQ